MNKIFNDLLSFFVEFLAQTKWAIPVRVFCKSCVNDMQGMSAGSLLRIYYVMMFGFGIFDRHVYRSGRNY